MENTAIERRERVERNGAAGGMKKTPPPEQTHAEKFYYQKQMQSKTPMVIVLQDGEQIHGIIEWYDKSLHQGHARHAIEPAHLQALHQVHVQGS